MNDLYIIDYLYPNTFPMSNPSENRDVRNVGEAERKNTEDQAARPQKG